MVVVTVVPYFDPPNVENCRDTMVSVPQMGGSE